MVEHFVSKIEESTKKIVLDFDPTDSLVYGKQEERHYHGYYRDYCFLPMHVFSGDDLVATWLRPSNIDGAKYAGAILKLIVNKIRQGFPDMQIVYRGDSAFARKYVLYWCENNNVEYVVGIPGNNVLKNKIENRLETLISNQKESGEEQKEFLEFMYKAESWNKERRVIAKIEVNNNGSNRRFLITNNDEKTPEEIYNNEYCPRGDMENKIKQLKLDLKGDKFSCHCFVANQFRNFITGLAYIIVNKIRKKLLSGTELGKAYCGRIMLKLFKIGAVIIEKKTKIIYLLSSQYPFKNIFINAMKKLVPG